MSDTIVHKFGFFPPGEPVDNNEPQVIRRCVVVCTPAEARDIWAALEGMGFVVGQIDRTPAMSLEDMGKLLAGPLKLLAAISAPYPFNPDGSLTEKAKADVAAGKMRVSPPSPPAQAAP